MSRILVVDDSPTVMYMVSSILARDGHNVLKAADGEEALRVATAEHPNLILLDVILPKLNGYQVCRQIKSAPDTASIPVIMLTSKARSSDRDWGIEQGADDYIAKPFNADTLLDVIKRLMPETG
jgi:twitching motility two-component system response regulator PilH